MSRILAYRQNNITEIHKDENRDPNAREMRNIASNDEGDGDKVMGKHLEVVLSPCLDVEHDQLMHPARQLAEIIKLDGARNEANGIGGPKVLSLEREAR